MIRAYLAMRMGGLTPRQINTKSDWAKSVCADVGIEGVSPWDKERIHYQLADWDEPIKASPNLLLKLAKLDKDEIRTCQIVIHIDGDEWSQGAEIETWFNRFYLWRPTIIVSKNNYQSLRGRETDYIASDLTQAVQMAQLMWGKRSQRVIWRLKVVYSKKRMKRRFIDFCEGWR